MDLSGLRTATYNRLGVQTTDPFFTTAVIDGYINTAIRRIATEFDWPWNEISTTFSTVAGTDEYSVPTSPQWYRTKALTIDTFDSLYYISLKDIREIPTTAQSRPRFFYVGVDSGATGADKIIVRPVPDSVYVVTHDYYTVEPGLTLSTDTPRLPAQYHEMIADLAAYYGLERNRENARAAAMMQSYRDWLKVVSDNRRRASAPMKVRVRPGAWV
jgi:hypothetical protein